MKSGPVYLSSFDIFDTLLTRRCGGPESIFREVGRRALIEKLFPRSLVEPERFLRLRISAETASRRDSPSSETSLSRIYQTLGAWLGLDETCIQRLESLELDLERSNLVALPGAHGILKEARSSSADLAFLSDMYLPGSFLKSLLQREGFYQSGDLLLVSGEEDCSKRNGRLYRRLAERSNVVLGRTRHFGNDLKVDVKMANQEGLRSCYLAEGNFNRYEEVMDYSSPENGGWGAFLAGTSRLTRLRHPETGILGRIAATVVAPVLVSFVQWLIQSCRSKEVRKLVFVSRDGFLLKEIADRFIKQSGGSEETVYLYGGRQAFHLPTLTTIGDQELGWILDHNDQTTLGQICQRLGLEHSNCSEALLEAGFDPDDWDRPIAGEGINRLREQLRSGGVLSTLIVEHSGERRLAVRRYFKSAGILDGEPLAFVDLGWHGNLEASFRALLGGDFGDKVYGHYFGLRPNVPEKVSERASTFLFGGDKPVETLPFLIQMLETFCTASHPPVKGFELKDTGADPEVLFESGHEIALKSWGNDTVNAVVCNYTDILLKTLSELERKVVDDQIVPVSQPLVRDVLQLFIEDPSVDEARTWGGFPYDTEQVGGRGASIAAVPEVNLVTVFRALKIGDETALALKRGPVYWTAGMKKLTPRSLNFFLALGKLKKRLAKKLKGLQGR